MSIHSLNLPLEKYLFIEIAFEKMALLRNNHKKHYLSPKNEEKMDERIN